MADDWQDSEANAPPMIAVLIPDLRAGGVERMRLHLARQWLCKGFRVEFVLLQARGDLLQQLPEGVTVVDLHALHIRNALIPLIGYLRTRRPATLLVAMWPLTAIAILAVRLIRFTGNVIVSDHIAFSLSPQTATPRKKAVFRASIRATYPHAYARIGVSRGVVDDLSDLSGLPRSIFKVVYNPALVKDQQPRSDIVPQCMSDTSVKQLLAVGTLKPQKDFGLLLRAFERLTKRMPARLTILGEGGERSHLESLVKQLGLEDSVSLPGSVVDTSPFYEAADLFVLCSRFEGFGNVIVEALSHGVTVVSTDCHSGPREILCDGQYGFLVPVGDVDALADSMFMALEAPMPPTLLQARASDFEPSRIADEYLRVMGLLS